MLASQWRRLALTRQGLTRARPFGSGISGVQKAIEQLGYVQIDTLSVIERAHHHVLWSRVPGYKTQHINELIGQKKIFEYWSHAAAYLPIHDYRFALLHMQSIRSGENRYYRNADKKLMKDILKRVKSEGPVRVRDVEKSKSPKGSWWSYGPGKRALEKLFMQGDLMVASRDGMEKIYDLRERCLPTDLDLRMPSLREYAQYLFETNLRAHGIVTRKQLLHLKTGKDLRAAMDEVLAQALETETISILKPHSGLELYVDSMALNSKPAKGRGVKILSPFDNAVIHRLRLKQMYAFDFRIECYVPAAKRVYGYFCLPILYGDSFMGRIDCKAHRAEGRFEIISIHLESAPKNREAFYQALSKELQNLAIFNQCPKVDGKLKAKLR